ncbi:ABC transporter ATP-binding protein [Leuconostocaceae bacterium ESL0958]|nr:ABC transporter ATP-binding protein [Leuconostocaceae bacterium ESL0958]
MKLLVHKLTGGYAGQPVLDQLSFELAGGQVVGLLGLNGAGKSTTFKHLVGERPVTAGMVRLVQSDGQVIDLAEQAATFRAQLAYIPEQPILYDELTLAEHLDLLLASHDCLDSAHQERVASLLKTFRLTGKEGWFPKHFSKGMQQKVMIVAAFAIDAPLTIIDEPFVGLDPLAQKALQRLMKARAAAGGLILLTTHQLALAEALLDQVILLEAGRVLATGSPAAVAAQQGLSESHFTDLFEQSGEAPS